ncbi:MAG: 4Fe-4S binding protein [Elusimicrobia bacterium]|nr:4Fe-4S binding protein [Candidatus Obscuribacterium magneticum]MCB4755882.1 4Fe-4S binding protein [Candidatus Obscuribacterium magneticum]
MTKQKSLMASLFFSFQLITSLVPLAILYGTHKTPADILAQGLWILFVAAIGFLIMRTGRVSRWRALFFIVMAWGFVFQFKAILLGLRGSFFKTPDIQEVPYCHIAIVSSVLNYAYQQYLALQSGHWRMWGPLSLGFLWVLVTLAIGQGFCSWGCFYGGLDEGFSRIIKRPLLKTPRWLGKIRDLPAALLIFMMLISLGTMLPIFCLWVCPLKITTAFLDGSNPERLIQMIIFIAVGVLALIVFPLLLKKRVFCGLLCPFGAWQAFFGRIHPVRVTISEELCTNCRRCIDVCPTFVLNAETVKTHIVSSYCNRCGECVDVCPEGAIDYTFLGRARPDVKGPVFFREIFDVKVLYTFACLLVGGVVGGLFVPAFLARLFSIFLK